MPYCVAGLCDNTSAAGYGMFSFPKDPGLNRSWRDNMKRVKSAREPHKLWENSVFSRLCGYHFEDSCFLVSPTMAKNIGFKPGKLQLKPDAIPTIFKRKPAPGQRRQPTRPRAAFEKRRRQEVSYFAYITQASSHDLGLVYFQVCCYESDYS